MLGLHKYQYGFSNIKINGLRSEILNFEAIFHAPSLNNINSWNTQVVLVLSPTASLENFGTFKVS